MSFNNIFIKYTTWKYITCKSVGCDVWRARGDGSNCQQMTSYTVPVKHAEAAFHQTTAFRRLFHWININDAISDRTFYSLMSNEFFGIFVVLHSTFCCIFIHFFVSIQTISAWTSLPNSKKPRFATLQNPFHCWLLITLQLKYYITQSK